MAKRILAFLIVFSLLFSQLVSFFVLTVYAAISPWTQTDWSTGDYSSVTNVDTTTTTGQVALSKQEKLTNTDFETDLSSWTATPTTFDDTSFAAASGAVAAWPLDDTTTTQSYARVINPADSEGRDIVINGGFDSDTIWSKGTGWTISGGTAVATNANATKLAQNTSPLVIGKAYQVTYDLIVTSGTVRAQMGGFGSGTTRSTSGTYTETITCSGSTAIEFYAVSSFTGTIDNVSVKQVDIPASASFTGTELLTDGNMETADTSAWTVVSNATLSKLETNPHSGLRVMRVEYGGSVSPAAGQTGLVVGKTYRVSGYGRGDGVVAPKVLDSTAGLWTGTTSTQWQAFDVTFVATTTNIRVQATLASSAGQYADFDDVSVIEVDPLVGKNTNGVTLNTASGGHLTKAYSFDPTAPADHVNIYSSDLNSVFNPDEGTLVVWAKYTGDWADGVARDVVRLDIDGSTNFVVLRKHTTANTLFAYYRAGGTDKSSSIASGALSGWFQFTISWSKSDDQVKIYLNGSQAGSTLTGLGTWVGNLAATRAVIGNNTTGGSNPWSGLINDVRLYNRALTPTEISNLYSGISATRDTGTKYAGSASTKLISYEGYNGKYVQSINVGDTNTYQLEAYAYTTGAAVTTSDLELYYGSTTLTTNITPTATTGWYKLTGTLTGADEARDYGVLVKGGKTVYVDTMSLWNYPTSGSLTSSIFDSEITGGAEWGVMTFSSTGSTSEVKVRTSNSSSMSGADDFSTCSVIASGSDISSNSCVSDGDKYAQYQILLSTADRLVTPTFQNISLAFSTYDANAPNISLTPLSPNPNSNNTPSIAGTATETTGTVFNVQFQMDTTSGSWTDCTADDGSFDETTEAFTCTPTSALSDGSHTMYVRVTDSNGNTTTSGSESSVTFTIDVTAPVTIELDSPGDNSYTNNERPTFKWKATTDATAGLSKYVLEIDNPSLGTGQPSGDFTIDDIPVSRTDDYETNKYVIHYENFSDSDSTNNYISVYTKSSNEWSTDPNSGQNDGKVREGKVSWKVKAIDNAGNETSSSRTLFADKTNPKVELTQINDIPFSSSSFSTTDTTPTIYGKITDPLAGGDSSQTQDENGSRVASGPKRVEIKVEKKEGLIYKLHTVYTINMDKSWYTCDGTEVADNSKQKCDKYLPFEYMAQESLDLGSYKITIVGKDKANNTSETSFLLTITTLDQIITPEEKDIIETEIKDLPKEEQDKVFEELEITKPQEPSALDKAGEQITETSQNIFAVVGSIVSTGFKGIGQGAKFAFNTAVTVIKTTGSALVFIGNKAGQATAFVGGKIGDGLAYIGDATGQMLAFVGQGVQSGIRVGGQGLAFVVETAGSAFGYLGDGYNHLANSAPGVAKTILIGIGNGFSATTKIAQNTALAIGDFVSITIKTTTTIAQSVGNTVASVVHVITDSTVALAHNIGNGISALASTAGRSIAGVFGNIANGSRNALASVAFGIGERTQFVSDKVGLAIIQFTYKFVSEPTTIANVQVEVLSATSVRVYWETNHPATGKVNWGYGSGNYIFEQQEDKRSGQHEFILQDLKPDTEYHYEVMSQNKNYVYDANRQFKTPAE